MAQWWELESKWSHLGGGSPKSTPPVDWFPTFGHFEGAFSGIDMVVQTGRTTGITMMQSGQGGAGTGRQAPAHTQGGAQNVTTLGLG